VILSAAYALFLYRRIVFGSLVKPSLQAIQDLTAREIAILAPLAVITIALGVYPKPVFDVTTPAVTKLIHDNRMALAIDHAPKLAQNHTLDVRKGAGR
jgi:NADH-quinone oxidoreductase subunit M